MTKNRFIDNFLLPTVVGASVIAVCIAVGIGLYYLQKNETFLEIGANISAVVLVLILSWYIGSYILDSRDEDWEEDDDSPS